MKTARAAFVALVCVSFFASCLERSDRVHSGQNATSVSVGDTEQGLLATPVTDQHVAPFDPGLLVIMYNPPF